MATVVLRCCGWTAFPGLCPHDGQYVESFQHNTADGLGYGEFTKDIRRAMQFETAGEALAFWKQQSIVKPLRSDLKPNRPMTAMSIGIVRFDDVSTS